RRGDVPPWMVPTLEMIRRNVEHEANIINDLLDVTRIRQMKLKLNREPVDVHAIVHEVIGQCAEEVRGARLSLTHALAATSTHVEAAAPGLRQVFGTLLKTAIQNTGPGGRIEVMSANDASGALDVTVADTGDGIDPELMGRLFEPFEQASRARPGGG